MHYAEDAERRRREDGELADCFLERWVLGLILSALTRLGNLKKNDTLSVVLLWKFQHKGESHWPSLTIPVFTVDPGTEVASYFLIGPMFLNTAGCAILVVHSHILKWLRLRNTVLHDSPLFFPLCSTDFRRRFLSLLSYQFSTFSPPLALNILQNRNVKQPTQSCKYMQVPDRVLHKTT